MKKSKILTTLKKVVRKKRLKSILLKPIRLPLLLRIIITNVVVVFSLFMILMVYVAVRDSWDNSSRISDLKYEEIKDLRDRIESLEGEDDTQQYVKKIAEKMLVEEPVQEILPIENISDCHQDYTHDLYTKQSLQKIDNAIFLHLLYNGSNNKAGWCLYMIQDNVVNLIAGGPNHRGISVLKFTQNKYVLYGQGCGTECYYIAAVNINDPSFDMQLGFSPYKEFSSDNQWLIFYKRQLYATEESEINVGNEDLYRYMAKAVNLNTFEEYYFAENIYFDKGDISDFDSYNDYWIDVFSYDYSEGFDFIDEANGIVAIPFTNSTSDKTLHMRVFNMNDEFREIH